MKKYTTEIVRESELKESFNARILVLSMEGFLLTQLISHQGYLVAVMQKELEQIETK